MPAITRSQSIKLQQSVIEMDFPLPPFWTEMRYSKVNGDTRMMSLKSWFIATIKQRLEVTSSMTEYKQELTIKRKCAKESGNKVLAKQLKKLHRLSYFDNIRNVDETMYLVQQYLPMLYKEPRFSQFTFTVYKKIADLYKQIHYSEPKMHPRTDTEHKIVNSMKSTIDETHEVVHILLVM
jgi:hypothetical protein